MKRWAAWFALTLFATASQAQTLAERGTLLDHLSGRWVMTGVIAGQEVVHDVLADWVLGGHYLYVHDRARERDESGAPAYEARVYIGWDEAGQRLVCLWLDVTGGGGLTPDGFGYARPQGDLIPFVWGAGTGSQINNTFAYDRGRDAWSWQIDNVRDGLPEPFARVLLTRNAAAPAPVAAETDPNAGILRTMDVLAEAVAPGGGGAAAYAAVLSEEFSRWTLPGGQVEGRQGFLDGLRSWMDDGWRVVSRESTLLDSTLIGGRAYTHRIVTESYRGPGGEASGPVTFSLEETWKWAQGSWLLHRVTVYPVSD